MHDIRHAARRLVRERAFSLIAIGTLSLGVAVVTASFAVVDAVLLQPIVAHQNRVVRFWKNDISRNDFRYPPRTSNSSSVRDRATSFEALAAVQYMDTTAIALAIADQPTVVKIAPVSPEFLPLVAAGARCMDDGSAPKRTMKVVPIAAVVSARYWRTSREPIAHSSVGDFGITTGALSLS